MKFKQIDSNVKSIFPNAKYIESIEPLIEDDEIYLTKKIHIQCCRLDASYSLVIQNENGDWEYKGVWNNLQKAMDKAIDYVFDNICLSMN